MIPTATGEYTAEYTNTCSCGDWNEATGEFVPADDCYSYCWYDTVQDFTNITEHLFTDNEQWFEVRGFPVWHGSVDGVFTARNAEELLRNITPDRTEWRIDITVKEAGIVARLYHHDAPTGGTMTVTPIAG